MRILLVNKFHYLKGGSETYYFELGKLLKERGHQVAYFSMKHEKNIKTGDPEYLVENTDMNGKNFLKSFNLIYSKKNKQLMEKAIREFKPDVIHINNFQRQITYSIIEAAKKHKVPIVYTSHDLQAVCPASAMLCKGQVCEKCLYSSKFNCYKNKCVKDSKLKSLLCSIEANEYKNKKIYDKFDLIISPSDFVANKLKEGGIKAKIVTLHNYADLSKFSSYKIKDENFAFYFGRLSEEKGILNLIKAFSLQCNGHLYIAGDGPEKDNITNYIKEYKLGERIKLLGFLKQEEVKEYISKCSFVVVPSIWYENCPYSIIETLAIGKPIVGSIIGGIPELIEDGVNGYLYKYDDINELSKIISKLFLNSELRKKMSNESKKLTSKNYDVNEYYKKLIELYKEVKEA